MAGKKSADEPGASKSGSPLAECPACGKAISPGSKKCPGCGGPVEAPAAGQAGKGWSICIVVGGLMVIAGFALRCVENVSGRAHKPTLYLLFFGFLIFAGGDIGEWLCRRAGRVSGMSDEDRRSDSE